MAVIGGPAGYATVNPTQGNPLGEAMASVESSAFKYRAMRQEEDQVRAAREKAARDARDKELKEQQAYADKHKIAPTAISSINKAVSDFSIDNKNLYNKAANTYKTSNNEDERRTALETMTNLESSFEMAKSLPEMLNASAKDLEEGVRQGKYNPRSSTNAAETIDAMNKGDMKVVFKENGIPTFITYKRDGNGNLTGIIDKELTVDQLKQKLAPIMAYDSKTNFVDFEKSLGKPVKTEEGNYIIEGYPNLKEAAEQNANSIITNRDKMYGIAPDAGVTPKTSLEEYTPEEIAKVKNYIVSSLESRYQPSKTTNDAKLNREQTARNQARIQANADREYRYKVNKDANEEGTGTTWGEVKTVTKKGTDIDSNIRVDVGDKIIEVMSEGTKDKTGAAQATRAVVVHRDGTISVAIDKNVGSDPLTMEPKIKQVTFSTKNNQGSVERALVGLKTPDGKEIKNLSQAKAFVKRYSGFNEKPKAASTPKKKTYTATQEKAISVAMKNNPGYSREEIISALKL